MSFLSWIVLGVISGYIASKIVNVRGQGAVMDIVLGTIGAIGGGWFFSSIGHADVTALHPYSVLVAVAGAFVVLVIYHALLGKQRVRRIL